MATIPDVLPKLPRGWHWEHDDEGRRWFVVADVPCVSPRTPAFVNDEFLTDAAEPGRTYALGRIVEGLKKLRSPL